jgi:hypothetical protein
MMLLSLLDFDFSKWDPINWILFAIVIAALLGYMFWPARVEPDAEVSVSEQTRKQARPVIQLPADGARDDLFCLEPMPLAIAATDQFRLLKASESEAIIRDGLWVCQRKLIQRLESELDYAQQADLSDHFAIAAPANQPATLLSSTLTELEGTLGKLRNLLQIPADQPLWHGRAMVLLLSNRKLFDHVAWLTSAGVGPSAPGAYTLVRDRVVLMPLYATRLGGFARPLAVQVARATLRTLNRPLPRWFEEGLAMWAVDALLGQGLQGETMLADGPEVLNADAWKSAGDDSSQYEKLVFASHRIVMDLAAQDQPKLIAYFRALLDGQDPSASFRASFGDEMRPRFTAAIIAARKVEEGKRLEVQARVAREQEERARKTAQANMPRM